MTNVELTAENRPVYEGKLDSERDRTENNIQKPRRC